MKRKKHRFILEVETRKGRKAAELDILCAFAKRDPDDCSFFLIETKQPFDISDIIEKAREERQKVIEIQTIKEQIRTQIEQLEEKLKTLSNEQKFTASTWRAELEERIEIAVMANDAPKA